MVLESLINPKNASREPYVMFSLGMIYVFIAAAISYYIFSEPSLPTVFLTTFAAIPLIVNLLKREEKEVKEEVKKVKYPFIGEHKDVFEIFTFLFLGMTTAFLILYIFLPAGISTKLFSYQIQTIEGISGFFTQSGVLTEILTNNLKVLLFCLLFSFVYGAGAVFIIAWNASILGVAIGHTIREKLAEIGPRATSYFYVIPYGFGRYLTHGIFEISAYFLAGIAGGIISAAVVRSDYHSKEFYEIILDSIDLIILAILLLIIGALVEVSITPMVFR